MSKVIAIAGLPASGKSFLGKQLADANGGLLVDDPSKAGLEALASIGKKTVVVTDPFFCFPEYRTKAEAKFKEMGATEVEWIFFESNVEQCLKNAKLRPGLVNGDIRYFASKYQIPAGVKTRPVFKNLKPKK